MNASRALIALMVGVSGAVIMIAGIRDVHPAIVLQQLLRTGTLPAVGATAVQKRTAKPTARQPQYSQPIGPGLPGSP